MKINSIRSSRSGHYEFICEIHNFRIFDSGGKKRVGSISLKNQTEN